MKCVAMEATEFIGHLALYKNGHKGGIILVKLTIFTAIFNGEEHLGHNVV